MVGFIAEADDNQTIIIDNKEIVEAKWFARGKLPDHSSTISIAGELIEKFEELPALKDAFYTLTPGKRRGYIIHFSQPKQPQSRISRIEKCIDKIMNGEGFHDAYKKK